MPKSKYFDEIKEQIVNKCYEINNIAFVARRHNISKNTIYSCLNKAKKTGPVKSLSKDKKKKIKEIIIIMDIVM